MNVLLQPAKWVRHYFCLTVRKKRAATEKPGSSSSDRSTLEILALQRSERSAWPPLMRRNVADWFGSDQCGS